MTCNYRRRSLCYGTSSSMPELRSLCFHDFRGSWQLTRKIFSYMQIILLTQILFSTSMPSSGKGMEWVFFSSQASLFLEFFSHKDSLVIHIHAIYSLNSRRKLPLDSIRSMDQTQTHLCSFIDSSLFHTSYQLSLDISLLLTTV